MAQLREKAEVLEKQLRGELQTLQDQLAKSAGGEAQVAKLQQEIAMIKETMDEELIAAELKAEGLQKQLDALKADLAKAEAEKKELQDAAASVTGGASADQVKAKEDQILALMDELSEVKGKLEETEDLLVELQEENESMSLKLKSAPAASPQAAAAPAGAAPAGAAPAGAAGGGAQSAEVDRLLEELKKERSRNEQLALEFSEMETMLAEEMEKTDNLAGEKAKLELKIDRLTKAGAGRGTPAAPVVAGRGKAE